MNIESTAKRCYLAEQVVDETWNKLQCVYWDFLPEERKKVYKARIALFLTNKRMTPAQYHHEWMKKQMSAGWLYGPHYENNPEYGRLFDPRMVKFDQLDLGEQLKLNLFHAIITQEYFLDDTKQLEAV